MSGGDVDVEPFLVSRNTLGNDEPQLKFSKPNAAKCVGVGSGQVVVGFGVSKGFAEVRWWYRKVYAKVVDVADFFSENSVSSEKYGRPGVYGHPVVGRPVPGRFRARDELLGFVVEVAKLVKSGRFCGWKWWR